MEEVCQKLLRERSEIIPSTHMIISPKVDGDRNAEKDHSKTIKTPIDIITDADGEPAIPTVTIDDGYQTKVVQATLRNYCTAHISEL
jgi:hypothetical protein